MKISPNRVQWTEYEQHRDTVAREVGTLVNHTRRGFITQVVLIYTHTQPRSLSLIHSSKHAQIDTHTYIISNCLHPVCLIMMRNKPMRIVGRFPQRPLVLSCSYRPFSIFRFIRVCRQTQQQTDSYACTRMGYEILTQLSQYENHICA